MYLQWICINNYRNFDYTEMSFHEDLNYFVGENAIGKSNFLDLLSNLSQGHGFIESDFKAVDCPIRIELMLQWKLPQSMATLADDSHIHLRVEQLVQEVYPRVYKQVGDAWKRISLSMLRHVVYVCHKDTSEKELYDIPSFIFESLGQLMIEKLPDELQDVVEGAMNCQLGAASNRLDRHCFFNIRRLMEYLEFAFADELVSRYSVDNVRLVIAVALKLVVQIYMKFQSAATHAESFVVTDRHGKRYLPIFISVDEPEIHLSPYLQRAVLSYYHSIVTNSNQPFLNILKALFNIDGLQGQLFIVTHSTDALVDDYRNIIRMYRGSEGKVCTACGVTFNFPKEVEKHLIMHFPEAKEALYARALILVEGETEYGSFGGFGRTIGVDFDYYGICLINARGEASIGKLRQLFRAFAIPTVSLYDKDVKEKNGRTLLNVFYTDEICYEMEIVSYLVHIHQRSILTEIVKDISEAGRGMVTTDMLRRSLPKLGLKPEAFSPRKVEHISDRDTDALRIYYFAWFYTNKGIIVGRRIAKSLTPDMIPPSFYRVIERAKELAVSAAN